MPLYLYVCEKCGRVIEILRKMSERDQPLPCDDCRSTSVRMLTSANLVSSFGHSSGDALVRPKSTEGTDEGNGLKIVDCSFENVDVGISLPKNSNFSIRGNRFTKVNTPVEFLES